MKLVGYEERSGSFSDESGRNINYDNFLLHLVGEFDSGKNGYGNEVAILKVKRSDFERISAYPSPREFVGQKLHLGYTLSAGKPVLCSITTA